MACEVLSRESRENESHSALRAVRVDNALHHQRVLPQHPLAHTAPSGLKFAQHFMDAVAQNVHDNVRFKGIVFEGERPAIVQQFPQGGVDL